MPLELTELLERVDQCASRADELSTGVGRLREQISRAVSTARDDPEVSLIRARRVLDFIIRDVYDEVFQPKRAGTQPLDGLVQALEKEGPLPKRLAHYAKLVVGLGNLAVHELDNGVTSAEVLNSLSDLLPVVEWYFDRQRARTGADAIEVPIARERIDRPHPAGGKPSGPPAKTSAPAAPASVNTKIGMQLMLIPAGELMMGSPPSDTAAFPEELPRHRVQITRPFYLGRSAVTRGQFSQFVAATGFKTDAETDGRGGWGRDQTGQMDRKADFNLRNMGMSQTDNHPVANVSWNDAIAFCKWLSEQEGSSYRLPTEAQWEYACRAGSGTSYFFGDDATALGQYCWYIDNAPDCSQEVGQKTPNRFGLHDMLGNVWQWCSDWFDAGYYVRSPLEDPQGPAEGFERVLRGGAWGRTAAFCRCAFRAYSQPPGRGCGLGFRVARDL